MHEIDPFARDLGKATQTLRAGQKNEPLLEAVGFVPRQPDGYEAGVLPGWFG
jgi:hypothetical protein